MEKKEETGVRRGGWRWGTGQRKDLQKTFLLLFFKDWFLLFFFFCFFLFPLG